MRIAQAETLKSIDHCIKRFGGAVPQQCTRGGLDQNPHHALHAIVCVGESAVQGPAHQDVCEGLTW